MTLTPVRKSLIFKSDDPDFNYKAAEAAYELVMKMDLGSARMFTEIVVSDVVEELIEKNLGTLQRHLDKVVERQTRSVRKALVRKAADDPQAALPYAQALGLFAKAKSPYDYGYVFRESDFNRDPGTGQFRTKISHTQKKPLDDRQAESMIGTRTPKKYNGTKLTPAQRAKFQDEYRQLAQFLSAVNQSGKAGSHDVILHFKDSAGNSFSQHHDGTTNPPKDMLLDPDLQLTGAQAKPNTLTVGGAAFGLAGALGGSMTTNQIHRVNQGAENFGDFAHEWTRPGDDHRNTNEKTYNRIRSGSEFVAQVAPAGSKVQIAATFGQFVGSMGPQAEAVIGPTARKTAYRYRGTEKTPEAKIVREYGAAINRAKVTTASVNGRGGRENLSSPAVVQMAAQRIHAERRAPDFNETEAGRAVLVEALKKKLPRRELSPLQLASGNTPPSEGFLINKDGQIMSQAVGYGDDHYLPFDLKNLKSLKGGQYVRTRTFGGPTSEDIYTGLAAGARQVTVVSHSGVFTVTFEEDLRGGRRHNDKARRMTRRYEQILNAVSSETVDRKGIDPLIRAEIVRQVREEYPGERSPGALKSLIKERIEEYKSNPELTDEDEAKINRLTQSALASDPSLDAQRFRREITNNVLADKYTKFRLDGKGYEAALETLQEQFPYYIKVHSDPQVSSDVFDTRIDTGYVEPGRNRPTKAKAGLFGTDVTRDTKHSAAEADYQGQQAKGGRYSQVRAPQTSQPAAPTQQGSAQAPAQQGATQAPAQPATQKMSVAQSIIQQRNVSRSSVQLQQQLAKQTGEATQKANPFLTMGSDEFEEWVKSPENTRTFADFVEKFDQAAPIEGRTAELRTAMDAFKRSTGQVESQEYNQSMALSWTRSPMRFDGLTNYKDGADPNHVAAEIIRIDGRTRSLLHDKKLSELTEEEMKYEIEALRDVMRVVRENPDLQSKDAAGAKERKEVASVLLGSYKPEAIDLLMEKPHKLAKRAEDVHRMRRLKTLQKESPKVAPKETPAKATTPSVQAEMSAMQSAARPEYRRVFETKYERGLRSVLNGPVSAQTPDAHRRIVDALDMLKQGREGKPLDDSEFQVVIASTKDLVPGDLAQEAKMWERGGMK